MKSIAVLLVCVVFCGVQAKPQLLNSKLGAGLAGAGNRLGKAAENIQNGVQSSIQQVASPIVDTVNKVIQPAQQDTPSSQPKRDAQGNLVLDLSLFPPGSHLPPIYLDANGKFEFERLFTNGSIIETYISEFVELDAAEE